MTPQPGKPVIAEGPIPLASREHNPDGLSHEQVGVADGWRLLDEDELAEGEDMFTIQGWRNLSKLWVTKQPFSGNNRYVTYRTRLSRAELRQARGLPEEPQPKSKGGDAKCHSVHAEEEQSFREATPETVISTSNGPGEVQPLADVATPTPETDTEACPFDDLPQEPGDDWVVPADFARTLERQRDVMRHERDALAERLAEAKKDTARLDWIEADKWLFSIVATIGGWAFKRATAHTFISNENKGLRDAIDQARKAP